MYSLPKLLFALAACTALAAAQSTASPDVLPDITTIPALRVDEQRSDPVAVVGWSFESIGYAKDVGRRRIVRIGPEGDAELLAPEHGDGILLRGMSDTARGDLITAPFAMQPYRWSNIEVRYQIEAGRPLVFVGLRPATDRSLVDLEFLPNDNTRTSRSQSVRLHSGGHEGPYSLAVSVGGIGTVRILSIAATEDGDYTRPTRPLCVFDIRSADPELPPNPNFARVASVFGFPSVEYLHYTEFSAERLDEIDPALLILPGLAASTGLDARKMDAAVLAAVQRDVPVVGVCLGHQILARAHGATLGRAAEWGPTRIEVVRKDPLFVGLPRHPRFYASESHDFEVTRPIGRMQTIASAETCKTQVFRYRGKPWYTFQGHIERGWEVASPEAVLLWKNMLRIWKVIPPR